MEERERQLRERLGIPGEAEKVLIFAESSHWDPNWLLTAEEYWRLRVEKILRRALAELSREPKRIFSLECIFFLRKFWERHPERQEEIRHLVNSGRLRLSGSGVTTPDTLLPLAEALVRDYLLGQTWLKKNGMTAEPRVAYLPDSFGHSPGLPSLLASLGYTQTAVSRIDGMFFPGADYEPLSAFPRPGSSAEFLWRDLKSLDFIWRGPDQSEVLCHWNAFTYGQGDLLGAVGLVRWMDVLLGFPRRSEKHVARQIRQWARQLSSRSRTPYLFCPIGFDFNAPLPGLCALLDRYNSVWYKETGLWAVNAGLEDYLDLVDCYRERLPVLSLDPNPYWMGFYASRPEVKQRCTALLRRLLEAEKLAALARERGELDFVPETSLPEAWWTLAVSNHHDFITGTSPDRVWHKEQRPMLLAAEEKAAEATARLLAAAPRPLPAPAAPAPAWRLSHGRLLVESNYYEVELEERRGGCLTRWRDLLSGVSVLAAESNDVVSYEDSGGLWRLGHEFRGGVFRERDRTSLRPGVISAVEREGVLAVEVRSLLDGMRLVRRLWFRADSPVVRFQLTAEVRRRRSITCRFTSVLAPLNTVMDVPGGVVVRPLQKFYRPTFWLAQSFVHVREPASERGLALLLAVPAGVSTTSTGVIELLALRNAPRERAFGFLPLLAHPAFGTQPGEQSCDYALRFTPAGDWRGNQLYLGAARVFRPGWIEPGAPEVEALADSVVRMDNEEVVVVAVKRAEEGEGLVVRLWNYHALGGEAGLRVWDRKIRQAVLCDGRERELENLPITADGMALVPLRANILTVKIL